MTDPFSQFMAGGDLPAAALSWLLDSFATPFLKAIGGKWQDAKERARWDDALRSYGESILRHYGRLRVLGKTEDVPLGSVFTDVYILDQISARRRFDIRELMEKQVERFDLPQHSSERRNGMGLVNQGESLYILGKPGAGKTTFLKNVAVRSIANRLGSPTKKRLPLFVPLHEWANSKHDELLPFLIEQLNVHHFPDSEQFLAYLLGEGKGLLLFDGLDEVRQESNKRAQLTRKLKDFTKKYDRNQFLVTCRVAVSEYSISGLRDVEMADFTHDQVLQYAGKWFATSTKKYTGFVKDIQRPENAGLAELCNVPLLLSILCLYYDDTQAFPTRRAELYADALDALLRKWDSSRQIERDEIYQGLSHTRKQQMFAHIATPAFIEGEYYFSTQQLSSKISKYLSNLPSAPPSDEIDGEAVLRAIEAQHGVLVERAHNIHSFSHITFQEYFTARYIVDNEARGTIASAVKVNLVDLRWREIFLLIASLLDSADEYVDRIGQTINAIMENSDSIAEAVTWASERSRSASGAIPDSIRSRIVRLVLATDVDFSLLEEHQRMQAIAEQHPITQILHLSFQIASSKDATRYGVSFDYSDLRYPFESDSEWSLDFRLFYLWKIADHNFFGFIGSTVAYKQFVDDYKKIVELCNKSSNRNLTALMMGNPPPIDKTDTFSWRDFTKKFGEIVICELGIPTTRRMSSEDYESLARYYYSNRLLLNCLELAYVTNRQEILDNLLRPPV